MASVAAELNVIAGLVLLSMWLSSIITDLPVTSINPLTVLFVKFTLAALMLTVASLSIILPVITALAAASKPTPFINVLLMKVPLEPAFAVPPVALIMLFSILEPLGTYMSGSQIPPPFGVFKVQLNTSIFCIIRANWGAYIPSYLSGLSSTLNVFPKVRMFPTVP